MVTAGIFVGILSRLLSKNVTGKVAGNDTGEIIIAQNIPRVNLI
jgi:hypothetical protein